MGFLIRVGSMDQEYPYLSDPPLSVEGVAQAWEAVGFFSFIGIGEIKAPMIPAALQFAKILNAAKAQDADEDAPPVIVCMPADIPDVVGPGGIISLHDAGDGGFDMVPETKLVKVEDLN